MCQRKRKTTVRSSNDGNNQTIECDMYDFQQASSNDVSAINEHKDRQTSDSFVIKDKTAQSTTTNDQYNSMTMPYLSHKKSINSSVYENAYDNVPDNNCELHDEVLNDNDEDDNYFYKPSTSTNKYQDQYTSTRRLKKKLNNSLPSIPPVVPPHANGAALDDRAISKHRVYVPSLNRYVFSQS